MQRSGGGAPPWAGPHPLLTTVGGMCRSKLYEMELQRQQAAEQNVRTAAMGSGAWSERIRTYNYQDGRVTDHRCGPPAPPCLCRLALACAASPGSGWRSCRAAQLACTVHHGRRPAGVLSQLRGCQAASRASGAEPGFLGLPCRCGAAINGDVESFMDGGRMDELVSAVAAWWQQQQLEALLAED